MRPIDNDMRMALAWVEEEAELTSALSGSDAPETRDIRRVEVTLRRLISEAGYNLNSIEADYE